METCLIESCGKRANTRGICGTCYQTAREQVKAGKTTWEFLEANNLCLPTAKKSQSRFLQAFNALNLKKE